MAGVVLSGCSSLASFSNAEAQQRTTNFPAGSQLTAGVAGNVDQVVNPTNNTLTYPEWSYELPRIRPNAPERLTIINAGVALPSFSGAGGACTSALAGLASRTLRHLADATGESSVSSSFRTHPPLAGTREPLCKRTPRYKRSGRSGHASTLWTRLKRPRSFEATVRNTLHSFHV